MRKQGSKKDPSLLLRGVETKEEMGDHGIMVGTERRKQDEKNLVEARRQTGLILESMDREVKMQAIIAIHLDRIATQMELSGGFLPSDFGVS